MSTHARNGSDDVSNEWLKKHLKALSDVPAPETLRQRLMADAAEAAEACASDAGVPPWSKAVGYVGVAAAVIVVACGIVRLGLPSGRTPDPVADHNENVGIVLAADHNSVRPPDTNVCDNNALR